VKEHPLLMKGPLVRATLEGRKTQTRRPLRNQPPIGYGLIRVCGPWAEFVNDVPPLAKFSTKSRRCTVQGGSGRAVALGRVGTLGGGGEDHDDI